MFHFTPFGFAGLSIHPVDNAVLPALGCPIRKSPGQSLFSGSPKLIATFYVLLSLLAPRHPPFALSSLITKVNHLLMVTQRIVLHALNYSNFSLYVVFKEHSLSSRFLQSHLNPASPANRQICLFSRSGGRDWI
jgi:hypothetical protein